MDERKSVEGTNAARDKPMLSDLSAQARACSVAIWRLYSYRHRSRMPRGNMAATASFCHTAHAPASARSAPVRSTAQERKIYGVFQLVSHKVQCANPGLVCTPDSANPGVGLRRRIDGMKDVSSRAGSQDSQRLHDWTQDEPVDDLRLDP